MSNTADLFKIEFNKNSKILIATILKKTISKEEAEIIKKKSEIELSQQKDYDNFIFDVSPVKEITSGVLGILMNFWGTMQKTNGYLVLVMDEKLLQEIMLLHPEMFDFFAVFHEIKDAVEYIEKKAS